ncbi:MAG: argininosuccinate lyase [Candidatus Brockarchaeota archaeon]|nr:argininosuccinate lyase [Candidatus Brockarchaeota archaeon]
MKSVYRSRFKRELAGAAASFVSSLPEDRRILDCDILGTMAHDIMLYERGIIGIEDLKAILGALQKIREKGELEGEGFEDVHEFLEAKVIEAVGAKTGGKMHTARSRNDQVVTAVRMRARADILGLCRGVLELEKVLLKLAKKHAAQAMPLYTHTQGAQVGTFGHYLISHVDALSRDFERLMRAYSAVNLNPLGACAIGGTSFPIDRERTTCLLGFDGTLENSVDAVSSRDFVAEVNAAISILMSHLSRMSEDLILWSTSEFDFIEIADEYSSPSSVMPQKKNPCPLELIRARTGRVYGCLLDSLTLVKGLPTGYNRDLQETKPSMWECFDTAASSLEVLKGVFSTLEINRRRMEEASRSGFLTAVDLAEQLVQKRGLSFREAHKLVGAIVKRCADTNRKPDELGREELRKIAVRSVGEDARLGKAFLKEALDPLRCLRRRRSAGSPNPREVQRMLLSRGSKLERMEARLEACVSALAKSEKALLAAAKRYITKE